MESATSSQVEPWGNLISLKLTEVSTPLKWNNKKLLFVRDGEAISHSPLLVTFNGLLLKYSIGNPEKSSCIIGCVI